ncbi:MAG: hypothetical protein A2411_01940 [Candidatus Pacebacteria bacterium RIFOXYC1_FULL_39_21]|nr:MAG: hypothetical protein A2411_01940 [Candidatus Pacebacteria bacterium RIFOXYC1_FULL_39_21]
MTLGFIFRFINLTDTPAGFNWDEASVGYNAYSLLLTGKDEFGRSWPIFIESFGDFKTGLYSMMLVPIINCLGLNVFSVRVLNVFIGTSLIIAGYFLGKQYFKRTTEALILAGLLAFSPLAIHLSRFTLEWYAALPLFVTGVGLLIHEKKFSWRLILATVLLGFSLYWYHSLRLILPFFLFSYFLIYRSQLLKEKKIFILSLVVGLLSITPLLIAFKQNNILTRPQAVAIFNDSEQQRLQTESLYRFTTASVPLRRILANKGVYYLQEIAYRYLGHFSPEFLFFGTDATPRISIHQVGKLQLVALPFLIIGFAEVLKKRSKENLLILSWVFLAPLPASLTTDAPHGLRSLLLLPVLLLIVVIGLSRVHLYFKKHWSSTSVTLMEAFIFLVFMANFLSQISHYFLFYAEETTSYWQADQQEMVHKLNLYKDQYQQVLVSTDDGQPYIFIAFFTPINPLEFQQAIKNQQQIFNSRVNQLGNLIFKTIHSEDYCLPNTLIITKNFPVVKNLKPIATVYLPNRWHEPKESFYFFETDNPLIRSQLCPVEK